MQIGEGLQAYISYSVNTTVAGETYNVNRRFSDFVWLRDQLLQEHAGCVVPPVPEKVGELKLRSPLLNFS
jgi:hypothetical protein